VICFKPFWQFYITFNIMKIDHLTPESAMLDELGRRLAQIRKQQGYTQEELAAEAGIGVATLRRIEGGQDSQLETWLKLLRALGLAYAIDAFLPENHASPMAEVRAASRRKRRKPASGIVWGDESE
tara:strand:- start:357 stop:734 length:378 start_codon:yes stop_codon:yes gene_type:complete